MPDKLANDMIKEPVSIPKGAKIICNKSDQWECEHGCSTCDGFVELKSGEYWLTRCCTKDLVHTMKRIVRDYQELVPNIIEPFTFISHG